MPYSIKMFIANIFLGRSIILKTLYVILLFLVFLISVCLLTISLIKIIFILFHLPDVNAFDFLVGSKIKIIFSGIFGVVFYYLSTALYSSASELEKNLPRCIVREAEKLLSQIDENDKYRLKLKMYIEQTDTNHKKEERIKTLKEFLDKYDKLQRMGSEITELTHTRDDATVELFEKNKEKRDLEKELCI